MEGYRHLGLPGSMAAGNSSDTDPGAALTPPPQPPSGAPGAGMGGRPARAHATEDASSGRGGLPPRGGAAAGSSTCLALAAGAAPASAAGPEPSAASRKRGRQEESGAQSLDV